jgi:hypothetical protein
MPDNRSRNMCQTLQPPCSNTCFSPTAPCPVCDSAHLKLAEIGCYRTCRVVIRPWLTKMWGIVPHLHLVSRPPKKGKHRPRTATTGIGYLPAGTGKVGTEPEHVPALLQGWIYSE